MNQPLNQAARILHGKLHDQLPRSGVKNALRIARGWETSRTVMILKQDVSHLNRSWDLDWLVGFRLDMLIWVVVSNIFYVHPIWGRFLIWLINICQRGWNHQLVMKFSICWFHLWLVLKYDLFCLIYQCMCTLHFCRFPFNWPWSSSSHLKTKIKKEEFCPKVQPCFNYVSIWWLPWALPERNAVKTCWILLRKVYLEYLQHFQMHPLSVSRGSKCGTLKILKLGCVWFLSYLPNIWRYKCRFGLALFSNCLRICYLIYHSKWFSSVQKCHLYCENAWLWRFFFRLNAWIHHAVFIHPTYIGSLES